MVGRRAILSHKIVDTYSKLAISDAEIYAINSPVVLKQRSAAPTVMPR